MSSVTDSLNDIFKTQRIVFWYDPEGEMRSQFDGYVQASIEKIEIENNEFSIKHRVSREETDKQFLVYAPFPRPERTKNWLLDLELGNYLFHADGISLVLSELGWQEEHRSFVEKYRRFFNSSDRQRRLAERLHSQDGEGDWLLKMLSVVVREEPSVEACLFTLLKELSESGSKKWDEVVKYDLDRYFWTLFAKTCKYESTNPTLMDLSIELLLAASPCGKEVVLGREAKVIVSRWKDSSRYKKSFEALSEQIAQELNIAAALNAIDGYSQLLGQDAFEAIEKKVITELRDGLSADLIAFDDLKNIVEQRALLYWYDKYENVYEALLTAAELKSAIRQLDLGFESVGEGVERYKATYWKIDQLYRHFRFHAKQSRQATLLDSISEEIEKRYANDYLLRLNDRFQNNLDELKSWPPRELVSQRDFFDRHVVPTLQKRKDSKLFVIISDAMRYEIGEELHRRITKEQRFRSKLEHAVSVLPSYTQLGMAALLPHKDLSLTKTNGQALADGRKTSGLEARKAILATGDRKATAIKASEFLALNTNEEGRALARDHDLIYIYQNEIDHTGDKRETEADVFEAVDRNLDILQALIRKVAAVNGNNILITADHGFLFTNTPLGDSDFTENPSAENVDFLNRRFAIGSGFQRKSNIACYSSSELGLTGELEVAIPKSINRFRVRGSGSRYVHGGASLQEVVIPVLSVNKARQDDVSIVDVDVIRGASNLITTSQTVITLYQEEPAVEKTLPRTLKMGFFSIGGELLSNQQEVTFDVSDSEARLRERKINFLFGSVADKKEHKNSEIILRLEERITGSNRDRVYKEFPYRLKKAFDTDFEY